MRATTYYRILLALVALVAVAYLGAAIVSTRGGAGTPDGEQRLSGSEGATSIIENFQHIESRLDKVGWELGARQAELLEGRANLYDIHMRFYTPEKEVITLEGKKGTIDLATNNITVTGDVVAVYNDTYRFYSDEVSWNAAKKVLESSGPVRIVGPEGEITGSVLMARPNKKRFVIKGGVSVDFKGNILEPAGTPREEPS